MKIKTYKDKKKEWRWKLIARNGNILADSGEGYKQKRSLLRILKKIFGGAFPITILVMFFSLSAHAQKAGRVFAKCGAYTSLPSGFDSTKDFAWDSCSGKWYIYRTKFQEIIGWKGADGAAGIPGSAGVSVMNATVSASGDLILFLSNGASINAGNVKDTSGFKLKLVNGVTITGNPGTPASLTVRQTAADTYAIDASIPKGEKGDKGDSGTGANPDTVFMYPETFGAIGSPLTFAQLGWTQAQVTSTYGSEFSTSDTKDLAALQTLMNRSTGKKVYFNRNYYVNRGIYYDNNLLFDWDGLNRVILTTNANPFSVFYMKNKPADKGAAEVLAAFMGARVNNIQITLQGKQIGWEWICLSNIQQQNCITGGGRYGYVFNFTMKANVVNCQASNADTGFVVSTLFNSVEVSSNFASLFKCEAYNCKTGYFIYCPYGFSMQDCIIQGSSMDYGIILDMTGKTTGFNNYIRNTHIEVTTTVNQSGIRIKAGKSVVVIDGVNIPGAAGMVVIDGSSSDIGIIQVDGIHNSRGIGAGNQQIFKSDKVTWLFGLNRDVDPIFDNSVKFVPPAPTYCKNVSLYNTVNNVSLPITGLTVTVGSTTYNVNGANAKVNLPVYQPTGSACGINAYGFYKNIFK